MPSAYLLVIACGVLALLYGLVTSRQVLTANAGSARMQEISGAVLVGARAYLNRQYRTIAIVGVVVLIVLGITLGPQVAIGYLIGAVLSATAGRSRSATPGTGISERPGMPPAVAWQIQFCHVRRAARGRGLGEICG